MSLKALNSQVKFSAPPRGPKPPVTDGPTRDHQDIVDTATTRSQSDNQLQKTLFAASFMAATFGAGTAHAAEAATTAPPVLEEIIVAPSHQSELESQLETELSEADTQTEQKKEGFLDRLSDRVSSIRDRVIPDSLQGTRRKELPNGWHLSFEPLDVDLRPRWEDGGPALKLKGDFLETSIQRQQDIGGGWTRTRGLRGELRGEVTTYDDPELDLNLQAFQRWEGPLNDDYQARFDAGVGIRHRFMGENELEEGLRAGVSFRQEIQGGGFEFRGHDYRWYMEGRQDAYYNVDTGQTEASYRFMGGPSRDFDVKLLGREGRITITAGPEIKGSTESHRDPLELGFKVKVRSRF